MTQSTRSAPAAFHRNAVSSAGIILAVLFIAFLYRLGGVVLDW